MKFPPTRASLNTMRTIIAALLALALTACASSGADKSEGSAKAERVDQCIAAAECDAEDCTDEELAELTDADLEHGHEVATLCSNYTGDDCAAVLCDCPAGTIAQCDGGPVMCIDQATWGGC